MSQGGASLATETQLGKSCGDTWDWEIRKCTESLDGANHFSSFAFSISGCEGTLANEAAGFGLIAQLDRATDF